MSKNLLHQALENRFLHWCKEKERKQEEQARHMQELQARAKRLQCENDQLWFQVEKSLELGKDVRDGDRAEHPMVHNKGKEKIISDDADAPVDDELSSGRSPSMSPSLSRNARGNTRDKSRRKHSHLPSLSGYC